MMHACKHVIAEGPSKRCPASSPQADTAATAAHCHALPPSRAHRHSGSCEVPCALVYSSDCAAGAGCPCGTDENLQC
jgi:hypothetical protein